jgi:adenylate cyclase
MRALPLLVFIAGLTLPVAAHAEPFPIVGDGDGASLGLYLDVLHDPAGAESIATVTQPAAAPRFERSTQEKPNRGYTSSVYWVRLTLRNLHPRDEEFIVEISSLLDHIALYAEDGRGGWRERVTGRREAPGVRDIEYRHPAFVLAVPRGAERTFYFRFASQGGMQFPLTLWTRGGFFAKDHAEQLANGAYFGILLVMALYNLFLFFAVADRSYLYYVLYIAGFAGFQLGWSGYLNEYVWPVFPTFANLSIPLFIGFGCVFGALFGASFLDTRTAAPRLDKVYRSFAAAGVGVMALTFAASYLTAVRAAILVGMGLSLLLFAGAVVRWRQGYGPARLFLFAWTALIAGVVVVGLRNFNVLPINTFTSYSHQLGSLAEVVMLSLALADRINAMKRERELADRRALEKQRRMTDSFARFVPDEFLRFLNKREIEDVKLGDVVGREMTVLFTDIRAFTTLSERMTPDETFRFINGYLSRVGPIIRKHGGFIDKYIGDAIMALFPGSPADAAAAGVEIHRRLAAFNAERRGQGLAEVQIGVGIHTGPLMLGTVGEEQRLETTVIADAVNLASRLEGLTKLYNAGIIVSEASLGKMGDGFHLRALDRVRVKGQYDTVSIVEVFEGDAPKTFAHKVATKAAFEAAMAAYREGRLDEAETQFASLAAEAPDDEVVRLYRERCAQYRAHGTAPDAESLEKY